MPESYEAGSPGFDPHHHIKLGTVAHIRKKREKNREFEIILGYTANLRSD